MKKLRILYLLFVLLPIGSAAQSWDFDDDSEFTASGLRFVVDASRMAAQCRGVAEGQQPATATVPSTIAHGGSTYSVVSISEGAFLMQPQLAELHLLSQELTIGSMAFNTRLQRLYLSATTPPVAEFYLFADPDDPYAVLTQTVLTRIYVPEGNAVAYLDHEWWGQYIIVDGDERTLNVITPRGDVLRQAVRQQVAHPGLVNHLTVSGPLSNNDIYFIRDSLTHLLTLDLSQALISQLPREAFARCSFSTILLPATLRNMGNSPFSSCANLEELVIPEGVLVADGLVFNCQHLKRLDLPSTLLSAKQVIMAYNFDDMSSFECTIVCRSFFPPLTDGPAIMVFGNADVQLQVPAVSAQLYAEASGWKDLPQQTFSQLPATVSVAGTQQLNTDMLPDGYQPDLTLALQGEYGGYGPGNAFGQLSITGSKNLSVGTFTMSTDAYSDLYWNGHYTCELLTQAPMTAQRVSLHLLLSENRWYFLAFPFDVKLADVVTDSRIHHWVVRSYSGNNRAIMRGQQWVDVPYGATLEAHKGYIWMVSTGDSDSYEDDLSVTINAEGSSINNLFARDDVSVTLADYASTYEHNASWNLVGNPYPCYYRIGDLQQQMPITVWNGPYEYDEYTTLSPIDDANRQLHPFQPFFLQKPATASALVFSPDGRVPLDGASARSASPQSTAARQVVNLSLQADGLTDHTRVVLNAAAQAGYERERDAAKFFAGNGLMPQLYTLMDGTPCAINERPEGEGRVSLGVRTGSEQTCTIALDDPAPLPVVLEDQLTGTLTDLTATPFTFTSRPGRDDGRFVLRMGAAATTGILPVPSPTPPDGRAFNLQGLPVNSQYHGVVIENGKLTIKR